MSQVVSLGHKAPLPTNKMTNLALVLFVTKYNYCTSYSIDVVSKGYAGFSYFPVGLAGRDEA